VFFGISVLYGQIRSFLEQFSFFEKSVFFWKNLSFLEKSDF